MEGIGNQNAGGSGSSYAGSSLYDTRSADAIKEMVIKYRNPNFQQCFDEATRHFGFIPVDVSKITSWEEFIQRLTEVCAIMNSHLLKMERDFSLPLNLETAQFMIMCKYVIEKYSPNSIGAKAVLNSFMQAATIDFTPRYGSSEEVSLRTFTSRIPVGLATRVHESALELERQIRNNALLMDIFATDSIRERIVDALAGSLLCGILPLTRDATNVQSNPVEVIDSAVNEMYSDKSKTYVDWLTKATDEGLVALKIEMNALVHQILSGLSADDRQPLIEFVSNIGATDQTLKMWLESINSIMETGYFRNAFDAYQLMQLLDVELIAGGLLEMCLPDNERTYQNVSEARNQLEFMNEELKHGVIQQILGNKQLFKTGWMRFHPIKRNIKESSHIGKSKKKDPSYEYVGAQQVADFLKVEKRKVNYMFGPISSSNASSSSSNASSSKYAIPLASSSMSIDSSSAYEEPLPDAKDIERRSHKLEYLKSLLGRTIEYSGSYLASLGQLFGPYLESVRGVGASLYGRSADLAGDLYSRSAGLAGDLYSRSAGLANSANQFVGSAFSSRDPISAGESMSSSISVAPSATPIAPSQLRGRPKDMSRREIEGSRQNTNNANSFEPSVVPTYVKNGGGASVQSSLYPTDADWEANINYGRTLSEENVRNLPSNVSKNIDLEEISVADNTRKHDKLSPKEIILNRFNNLKTLFKNIKNTKYKTEKTKSFKRCIDLLQKNLNHMTHPSINIVPTPIPTLIDKDYEKIDKTISDIIIPVINENIRILKMMSGGKLRKTRKPMPSMSKNKKTLRRNPRKLISRRQKYSRRK